MRRASSVCCATRLLLAALAILATLGIAGCAPVAPEGVPLQHYTEAYRQIVPVGAVLPEPGIVRPSITDPGWEPVQLPLTTPRPPVLPVGGESEWDMHWYHVRYVLPAQGASPPLALYVPRVRGGPYEVHANDRLLVSNRHDWRSQWNRPVYVPIPHDVVFTSPGIDQVVDIVIGIPLKERAAHALSTLWVGPMDVIRPMAERRLLVQVTGPQVTSLTILVLGLFSFGFWWGRRKESAYLFFAAVSAVWWLRNLHYHIDAPRGDVTNDWFWWATNLSMSWVMVLTYLFAFRIHHQRYRRAEQALVAFAIGTAVLTVPPLPWDALVLQHVVNAVVSVFVTGFITWVAWRHPTRELIALTVALWICIGIGVHDILLLGLRITPESVYLMPYGTLLIFGAFLYAVLRRYRGAIDEVERINASLEQRLAQRTAELEENHRRLRVVEREQAQLLERQRLMRDMHDGMGSALMSSLVLVEQGKLDMRAVADVLRECVDDLRLVIDSLEPIGHDLVTLLATLRYRLGRRLEAAGLRLDWQVEDLPPLPWLDATAALQVLRIVQEALTNILKHAQARGVGIELRRTGNQVHVLIRDDGRGFDVEAAAQSDEGGRGLRNLRKRAQTLGGDVEIQSRPGDTCVRLVLPLVRE